MIYKQKNKENFFLKDTTYFIKMQRIKALMMARNPCAFNNIVDINSEPLIPFNVFNVFRKKIQSLTCSVAE